MFNVKAAYDPNIPSLFEHMAVVIDTAWMKSGVMISISIKSRMRSGWIKHRTFTQETTVAVHFLLLTKVVK